MFVNFVYYLFFIMCALTFSSSASNQILGGFSICDTKGHLSNNFNSYSYINSLSHNFKMLHFDANPIKIGISGYRFMKNLSILKTI